MLAIVLILAKWLGLLGMVTTAILGWFYANRIDPVTHYTLGMVSTFVFAAAQTMIVYYFIGMSKAVRLATEKHGIPGDLAAEALALKKQVAGRGYLVLMTATAALILGGGSLFGQLPVWLHYSIGGLTIMLGIATGLREWPVFRRNAALYNRVADSIYAQESKT